MAGNPNTSEAQIVDLAEVRKSRLREKILGWMDSDLWDREAREHFADRATDWVMS